MGPRSWEDIRPFLQLSQGEALVQLVRDRYRSVQNERFFHLVRLQQAELVWRGQYKEAFDRPRFQHNGSGWQASLGPFGGPGSIGSRADDLLGGRRNQRRWYTQNYYYGDGMKLIGVLGLSPNTQIQAIDSELESNIEVAAVGQRIRRRLEWAWQMDELIPDMLLGLFHTGNQFAHVSYVSDRRLFGQTPVPVQEMRPTQVSPGGYPCDVCGFVTPEQQAQQSGGTCAGCGNRSLRAESYQPPQYQDQLQTVRYQKYDNGGAVLRLWDCYSTYTAYRLDRFSDAKWLVNQVDVTPGQAISMFPQLRQESLYSEYAGTSSSLIGNSRHERAIREQSQNPSSFSGMSDTRQPMTVHRHWMEPEEYEELPLIDRVAGTKMRDLLMQKYPNGVRVTFLNERPIGIQEGSLHDEWAAAKPTPGKGFYTRPLGREYVEAAQTLTEALTIAVRTMKGAIPMNLYLHDLFNKQLFSEPQDASMFVPVNPKMGQKLRDMLYSTTPGQMSTAVPEVLQMFINGPRENSAMTPELWGAGPVQQTYGASELVHNQALRPHNTTWNAIRAFVARCYENGLRQYALYAPDQQLHFATRPGFSVTIEEPDYKRLLEGGWKAHCDEQMPVTWNQIRGQVWKLIEMGPQVMALFGLDKPGAIRLLQLILGNDEFVLPDAHGYDKAMMLIERLSQEEPLMPPADPLTGQPTIDLMTGLPQEPQPSIPADEFEDNHGLMVATFKEWAQKRRALNLRYSQNPQDQKKYLNVLLWAKQHQQYIELELQRQAMLQAPPASQAGQGGGKNDKGTPEKPNPENGVGAPSEASERTNSPGPPSGFVQ
jgi:hypothetical protein